MDAIEKLKGVRISSLDDDGDQEPVNIDSEDEDYDDSDDDEEQEPATLGFVEKPKDEWLLYRQCFPSKAGGVPAWLDPVNMPSGRSFMCDICGEPLQFLLQVYAPIEKESTFHRMIYVFMCLSMKCLLRDQHEQWKRHPEKPSRSVKVFRCQLSCINPFYSSEPPKYDGSDKPSGSGAALCDWCGTWKGDKLCSSCRRGQYCSEKHQFMHWRSGHKITCQQMKMSSHESVCAPNHIGTSVESHKVASNTLWPEFSIIIDDESEYNTDMCEGNALATSLISRNRIDDTMDSLLGIFQGDDDKKSWAYFQQRIAKADDEHHGEISPPRLYMNTSSSSGDTTDEEEDVPSISKCVVKEGKDIIMTHLKVRKPFDEGTSASDDHFDKIEESEVPSQEIGHEEQDMRSSTSSDHMEIASSSWFGGYEKDDVPLLLPKSDNIIDGETQIVSIGLGQMERSIDQSQESGSQGYEKDDNPPLLPKSNLKVDKDNTHLGTSNPSDDDNNSDHESSNDEGSDDDGFHGGTGCNFGVGRRGKDPGQESDHQEQENTRPLRADISEIVSGSNLREGDVPLLLSESKNMEVDRGQMEGIVDPRDGINYEEHGEMSAPCGDMKIRRSEKFVNGFRNSKKFVSASRNSKKFVSRSRISKKISVIFLNKLVHYRDALKYVLLSFVVFITTLGFLIYQDSRRAAPFVPLGILTGIVCLLAALSASVFTDKTRSALNDNTDSKNGELSHTDSDLDAWLVDEEHNRVHCRHCIDELLLKQ